MKTTRKIDYSKDIADLFADNAKLMNLLVKKDFDTQTIGGLFSTIVKSYDGDQLALYASRLYNMVPSTKDNAKKAAMRYYNDIVISMSYLAR